MLDNEILSVRLDELPYLSHSWKNHKYIKKIGDRYFYTIKELQAYYNSRKAKALGKASVAIARLGANAGVKAYSQSWDPEASLFSQKVNEKISKACLWVSKKLGKAAAKAAEKVIKANADITKRQVDSFISEKFGAVDDIRDDIKQWVSKYI